MVSATLGTPVTLYPTASALTVQSVMIDLDASQLVVRYLLTGDLNVRVATVNIAAGVLNNVKTAIQNAIGTQLGVSVTVT